jgi:hypothetical protein
MRLLKMPDPKKDFVEKIRKAHTDNLHAMNLHEHIQLTQVTGIVRVPGGWLYYIDYGVTFVPWNEEFRNDD